MGLSTALYVTVPEVKSEIDIPSTRADFDLSIQVTVESICRQIDDYTGHVFYSATGTRYYTPTESTRLRVDDLLTITTLRSDEDGNSSFETTWSTGDYYLAPFNATAHPTPHPYYEIITRQNSTLTFPTDIQRSIEIVGIWGFNHTTAGPPAVIKKAALFQAARDFKAKDAPFGIVGGRDFSQQVALAPGGGLHPFVKQMLDPFRLRVVA